MCFSASASFTASAALGIIGLKAVSSVTKKEYLPLASVPLLFCVQQFLEGLVWLSLQNEQFAFITSPATYGYIFFAYSLWPCWIPFSILATTQNKKERALLYALLIIGMIVAVTLLYHIILFGASAQIGACHILYTYAIPETLVHWGTIGYLMATVIPFFATGNRKMYVIGALVALAYAVSYYVYYTYLTSVWCFFAALISLSIVWAKK